MSALSGDYTDCSVLIYDSVGKHLCTTVVTDYDKVALRLTAEYTPDILDTGEVCRLLILTAPTPCEYQGRVLREGVTKVIALFQGREKEDRGAVRYKVDYPALIENLICNDRPYALHTPLEVRLINISKRGVRFSAPPNSLSIDDRFQMSIKISDNEKLLIADVVNHLDKDFRTTEYGCRFLVGSERGS